MEILVQGLFVCIEDGKTTLDKGWRLNLDIKEDVKYYIAPGQIWSLLPQV